MPGGGCLFQTKWKSDPQFKDWIQETDNSHSAYCKLCKKNVDIKTMGRTALTSHMKGKKHLEIFKVISVVLFGNFCRYTCI